MDHSNEHAIYVTPGLQDLPTLLSGGGRETRAYRPLDRASHEQRVARSLKQHLDLAKKNAGKVLWEFQVAVPKDSFYSMGEQIKIEVYSNSRGIGFALQGFFVWVLES